MFWVGIDEELSQTRNCLTPQVSYVHHTYITPGLSYTRGAVGKRP